MNQFNLTEAECDSASRNLSEMKCSEKLAASPPELKQWTTSETLPCPDVVLWIEDGYFYQRQHDDYFHDQFYWKRNLQIKYHTVDYLAIQPHVNHYFHYHSVNLSHRIKKGQLNLFNFCSFGWCLKSESYSSVIN